MRTTDLSELAAFDAAARLKSFTRAGAERGVTGSAISHAVSNLEARVGLRLLNRSTRNVSLTDAGAALLSRLSPAFGDIGSAMDRLNQYRETPFGKVRINAPSSGAAFVLGPMLGPLIAANPNLELEIITTDRLVDIVEEGFDAGIRLGESLRDGMTAVRMKSRLRFAVVASPSYFERHPPPRAPADLKHHICIQNLYPTGVRFPWEFKRGPQTVEFQPSGPVASDNHEVILQAALAGAGLAYIWEHRAERDIQAGSLMRCLEPWCQPEEWLYLYYPTRKYISAGLRAVIEHLRA